MEYYIVSLKHTSKGDAALTFWRKDAAGYTWHRDSAGVYSLSEASKYAHEGNVAVLKEKVDLFWMNAVDFEDRYISVPNNSQVLHALSLSDKSMKPKKWKTCRMQFINQPVTAKP